MKLRLQKSSVRLRLSEDEVAELASSGRIAETVSFDGEGSASLTYEVIADADIPDISALFQDGRITVSVPVAAVRTWAESGDVVLTGGRTSGHDMAAIIIEKDLARRRPERAMNR